MKLIYLLIIPLFITACNSKVAELKNIQEGKLKVTQELKQIDVKKFLLDDDTAPRPQYIEMVNDTNGNKSLSFLNIYNNSIYFYDYRTTNFIEKITYEKNGPNGILKPLSYHFMNKDSIYVYDYALVELLLTNNKGEVLNKTSMIAGMDVRNLKWLSIYPQFYPETSTPFIRTSRELLLTGQYMRGIPEKEIDSFKLTARVNLETNKIRYSHGYPKEIYGNDYNWNDEIFTRAFPLLHPEGDKIIYSFAASHDLYIADLKSNDYKKVYGGSNLASTIYSMNTTLEKTSREKLIYHILKHDIYGGILYDKYRKFYYRFLKKAMPEATGKSDWKKSIIAVIIMDHDFNYLGETTLGDWGTWHWQNSFVTKEGLNIEYIDNDEIDEVSLTLKIFVPKLI